jgi:hypothetical protein
VGPTEINGLPAHILLVHVVIVLVPLSALCLVLSAWWPVARRRLGILTPLLALGALVAVPVTTHAGEWLLQRVAPTPLIARHVTLGKELLPWVIAMFVIAVLSYVWFRLVERSRQAEPVATTQPTDDGPRRDSSTVATLTRERAALTTLTRGRTSVVISVGAGVLSLVVAVGSVVQVYRIGEAGSKAVWTNNFSQQPR